MIVIKCFAQIREVTQVDELSISFENGKCISDLRKQLENSDEVWRRAFSLQPLMACNHVIVNASHVLNDGDEVAFFPPVTGG